MASLSPAVRAFLAERRFCIFADSGPDGVPHRLTIRLAIEHVDVRGFA